VRYVLFGINWELIPEKIAEAMKLYEEDKVVFPEGLEVVEEYAWGNQSLEIVKADNMGPVMDYILQFTPFVRNFKVEALVTLRELLAKQ
jgi:hypothetical protein